MPAKRLTRDNWLEADPTLRHFVLVDPQTGSQRPVQGADWVELFLRPRLSDSVPSDVAELIEAARGAMLYGYFFYPLYAIAEDQLFIATEAALRAKYVAVTGSALPAERLPHFKKLRSWALKEGVLPKGSEAFWEAREQLRNLTAHTGMQRLGPPGQAADTLARTCGQISALFDDDVPTLPQGVG